jgi:DNA polymerase-3 subunit delta'
MTNILGHDAVVERFRNILARGRLASTYLFVGPPGVGKRTFAIHLAKSLFCERRADELLDPCGECPSCLQVAAGTHPDLELIERPKDKSFIPVSTFIGEADRRMQEGLCHRLSLKPFLGGRKIAIIDDADYLNEESANCLLKTLEEPPPRSLLVLISTSVSRQLPTIRSRSQIVRFAALPAQILARLLLENGVVEGAEHAQRLAEQAEGSFERAADLSDGRLWTFRKTFLARLADPGASSVRVAEEVIAYVDQAGTEAPVRREAARQVIGVALDYYRRLMRDAGQRTSPQVSDTDRVARNLDRCIDALVHVDRNANQATLLAAWVDDLKA